MAPASYTHTFLKRRVRFEAGLAYVEVGAEAEAIILRDHLYEISQCWPTGCLRLDHNGKGRRYVRLGWADKGEGKRLSLARIIVSLERGGEQAHREVHYRDRNPLNLLPANLILGGEADCGELISRIRRQPGEVGASATGGIQTRKRREPAMTIADRCSLGSSTCGCSGTQVHPRMNTLGKPLLPPCLPLNGGGSLNLPKGAGDV